MTPIMGFIMKEVDKVYSCIVYLSKAITLRPDGRDYLPLLNRLKSEYDRMRAAEDLMEYARSVARAEGGEGAANISADIVGRRA